MKLYFNYWTEIFIFAKLLGWTHASWWWVLLFVLSDQGAVEAWKKYRGLK